MTSFGERLKAERIRLGKTQVEFSEMGCVSKGSQLAYEKDTVSPTADYLMRLGQLGVDIHFLFYDMHSDASASSQVNELLTVLVQMPPAQQAMSFAVMNLFHQTLNSGSTSLTNADEIWRAARLFKQFLAMSQAGKTMVELAAKGGMIDPPSDN